MVACHGKLASGYLRPNCPSCVSCGGESDVRALGCKAPVGGGRGGYLPIASTPILGITLAPGALARDSHGEKELDAEGDRSGQFLPHDVKLTPVTGIGCHADEFVAVLFVKVPGVQDDACPDHVVTGTSQEVWLHDSQQRTADPCPGRLRQDVHVPQGIKEPPSATEHDCAVFCNKEARLLDHSNELTRIDIIKEQLDFCLGVSGRGKMRERMVPYLQDARNILPASEADLHLSQCSSLSVLTAGRRASLHATTAPARPQITHDGQLEPNAEARSCSASASVITYPFKPRAPALPPRKRLYEVTKPCPSQTTM